MSSTLITVNIKLWHSDSFKELGDYQIPINNELLMNSFKGDIFLSDGKIAIDEAVQKFLNIQSFPMEITYPNITKETKKLRKNI